MLKNLLFLLSLTDSQYVNMNITYKKQLVFCETYKVTLNESKGLVIKAQDFCVYRFHASVISFVLLEINWKNPKTKSISCNLFPLLSCEMTRYEGLTPSAVSPPINS